MVTLCTVRTIGRRLLRSLGGADEASGHSGLLGRLPGVAGRLASRVARAVGGYGGNRAGCRHPWGEGRLDSRVSAHSPNHVQRPECTVS